jgi:hypothetical protein
VSRPLAGHALRELDSLIRSVLTVPLDARAADTDQQKALRREARRTLKKMGFDDAAVRRAGDELGPRYSHRVHIERLSVGFRQCGIDEMAERLHKSFVT